MNSYTHGFRFKRNNNKVKKPLKLIGIIAAFILAVIMFIGIIAGSDSAENRNISAAIAENTQLKQQLEDAYAQIDTLSAEIARMREQIEAMPSPSPTPYVPGTENGENNIVQPSDESVGVPRDEVR